ncbi:MAG: FAD-dependent oxidoreductase, partial [Methanosarcinales archaeon]|nr:FAD-dependent oxidoreductase [Methanosarcinales archaeon]
LTGKRVREVEHDRVLFEDLSTLECEMVIWTAGIKAPPFVESLDLPKQRCWLLADPFLRSRGREDIFVIGDCAWIEVEGKVATKTGIEAERQAKHAARNLNRLARGKSLLPYSVLASPDNRVAMISTGCGCALCVYGNSCLPVPSRPMYLLKRWIDKAIANRYK